MLFGQGLPRLCSMFRDAMSSFGHDVDGGRPVV